MSAAKAGRAPLVRVEGLRVGFGRRGAVTDVVHGLDLHVHRGEALALVGESGSGKSVTARALVGLVGARSRVRGRLELDGEDLTRFSERTWRQVRGARVGFVLQDALSSLDPLRRVGAEVAEPLRLHGRHSRSELRERVQELLRSVGVPEPEVRARQLPHELSGGLRQRALIATAIANDPDLLIADEPTTALDTTVQRQVLHLLGRITAEDKALIVVSHDLAVVAELADRVAVMQDGRIVEQGPVREVLSAPAHPYTQRLLAAVPVAASRGHRLSGPEVGTPLPERPAAGEVLLEAHGVGKTYAGPDGHPREVVRDVSLTVRAGETLGIVGESGSGKTTTARILVGVEQPSTGTVTGPAGRSVPATGHGGVRRVQLVYQDPIASFDPRYTVERVLAEAAGAAGRRRPDGAARVAELLGLVGLEGALRSRRPLQLSGGQRQRVAIARALAAEPDVIVFDEPVSALDVSVQAQVLDLLADLQHRLGLAYVLISHDLAVVQHLADHVAVMQDGRVVERGPVTDVFAAPEHPHTQDLLTAVPHLETLWSHT